MNTPQSQEPPVKVTERSVTLAEWYTDPVNRFYRYPLARLILPLVLRTPLTPNHITAIHVVMAFVAAWFVLQGGSNDLILAAAFYELRNVLDCLDGVVARAKKTASLHGAVIDELADGLGFTVLLLACGFHLYEGELGDAAVGQTALVYAFSILMAMNYVLQKNRFHAPLATGVNEVELKLHERWNDVKMNPGTFMPRFVWLVEQFQNVITIPGQFGRMMSAVKSGSPLDRRETTFLICKANDPKLLLLLLLMSISTGEYVIIILQAGLVLNDVAGAFRAVLLFAPITFVATTLLGNLYMRAAYHS